MSKLRKLKIVAALGLAVVIGSSVSFAKTKHQVMGTGPTQPEALREAHNAAGEICFNYRTTSEKTTKSGDTWTCILMIECPDK